MYKILVITPTDHIEGLNNLLNSIGEVTFLEDPVLEDLKNLNNKFDAVYTNPNKTKIFIDHEFLNLFPTLKVICTASTGTNHIDKDALKEKGIELLSLTNEREIINLISSTAEHAFALTISSLRNIVSSYNSVLHDQWDYTQYIGRQFNGLAIGVIGFGRLGKFYAKYCYEFGAKIYVFDPYVDEVSDSYTRLDSLQEICKKCDVLSIHVHVSDETINLIDLEVMNIMKKDVLIINTSRGEVINEKDLINFLKENKKARIATDVIANEITKRLDSQIIRYAKNSPQVLITPHIGGMTKEAQEIAYNHAARMLIEYFQAKYN